MKTLFLATTTFLLLGTAGFSQTKKIAFESHSGNAENFSIALSNELFDSEESDFGLPPNKTVDKVYQVTFLNDSVSVIEVKQYERPWKAKSDSMDKFVANRKDTLFNTIKKKEPLDSIKKNLAWHNYEFSDKVILLDLTGKKKIHKDNKQQQQQIVPLFTPNDPPDNNSPFDPKLIVMLGSILLLSVVGGFISWKLYKPQPAIA